MAVYTLVTDDGFVRANTLFMYAPSSLAVGNGWIDPIGASKVSIAANLLAVAGTSGGLTTSHIVRPFTEWTRDGACVVDQPGYTQAAPSYTGFGAALAFTGEAVIDRNGYYATWQTSGTTGILQIWRCSAGTSTAIASSSPATGPVTTNGFVIVATKNTVAAGQNILTVALYTGAAGTNPFSGDPNAPGTPIFAALSFTDTTPGLFNQGSGGFGATYQGATVGTGLSRIRTYTVLNTLRAVPNTPLYINSTVTITLTGGGAAAWVTTPPTFTAVHKTTPNGSAVGFSITSQNITAQQAATITVNTGSFVGSITITDPTVASSTYVLYVSKPIERWCVVGDSISYQPYGATLLNSFKIQSPYWVAKSLMMSPTYGKEPIVNATGVVGSTTTTWLSAGTAFAANMPAIVAENPNRIYIMLGANDATGSISQATYLSNMTSIINYLIANTTSLIHIIGPLPRFDASGPTATTFINQYNDPVTGIVTLPSINPARVFHDNATSQAIFTSFAGRPELFSGNGTVDGLHPGDLGMLLLGQGIATSILAVTNPAPTGATGTRFIRRF